MGAGTQVAPRTIQMDSSIGRQIYKLLKPGLAGAVVFTIAPGLLLGPRLPSVELIVLTMLGTFLTAMASFVYNQIIEIRTDALMERTRSRPLPAGQLSVMQAYLLGSSLLGAGLAILALNVNLLAMSIALASFLYYVFLYTAWLKPLTAWNTALGGAAGAVGPLIGEAAVSGEIGVHGVYLFILLFLWQPPHFWCLGLKYKDEYAAAGLPILPVAKGVSETMRQMLGYQWLLVAFIALGLYPLGLGGIWFGLPSLAVGALVLWQMYGLRSRVRRVVAEHGEHPPAELLAEARPLRAFFLTILHMLVWHGAMAIDLYFRIWA